MQKFPWLTAASLIGACFLSILYGSVAVHMGWWPSNTVQDAKLAFRALNQVAEEEFEKNWPASMESIERSDAMSPTVTRMDDDRFEDLIFVDGGAQQLRSHCPENGCIAWVINRDGKILHTWKIGAELVWQDLQKVAGFTRPENIYSVGAHPFANGDLLVTYQGRHTYPYGVGMARFDKDSKLLWKKENFAHHWLSVDDAGYIYASVFAERKAPTQVGDLNAQFNCDDGKIYEDIVVILDPDGNEIERISMLDTLIDSGYAGLVFQAKHSDRPLPLDYTECDPTHLNDVQVISHADAESSEFLNSGDLLVSMRSINTIAVIDRETRQMKWVSAGRAVLQHSPRYLGNNSMLLFDNLGGSRKIGGSRLLSINMTTNEARTLYPRTDKSSTHFFSATAGYLSLHESKNRALVSLTRQGRTLEIDLHSGAILWEYHNIHDVRGLTKDAQGNDIKAARFATQTVSYFNHADFKFNSSHPEGMPDGP